MPVNQRFAEGVNYYLSKTENRVKSRKAFYSAIGMPKTRFDYIYYDNKEVDELKPSEITALTANYPEVDWANYVNTGNGSLLSSKKDEVQEDQAEYNSKQWYQQQLNLIIASASKLPAQEQLKILRAAYVERNNENIELKNEIIRLQQAGQTTLLDELKEMIKGKK